MGCPIDEEVIVGLIVTGRYFIDMSAVDPFRFPRSGNTLEVEGPTRQSGRGCRRFGYPRAESQRNSI